MLLPRRRLSPDSGWSPRRVAAAGPTGGLQKAQSVQSLVPQGEAPGGSAPGVGCVEPLGMPEEGGLTEP